MAKQGLSSGGSTASTPTQTSYTPAQVAQINSNRAANVAAGKNAYSGDGATPYSEAMGQGQVGPITEQTNTIEKALQTPTTAPTAIADATTTTTTPTTLKPTDQAPQALTDQVNALQQGVDKYKQQATQGLAAVTKAGVQPPSGAGAGSAGVTTALATQPNVEEPKSVIGSIIEADNSFDSILTEYDKFNSPTEQRKSLLQEYQSMSDALGISGMNAELINSKRVIEGTEDDIRNEITSVGGMATESQVLALSNARNKSLIKNYNYLLEARDSAQTQLSTMMNLTIKDREMASAEFDRKMNFAFKVADFKQKAVDNARSNYNNIVAKVGYAGLMQATNGNAYEQGIIEKTLGLGSGGLAKMATFVSEEDKLDLENKKLQNQKLRMDINEGSGGGIPTVKSINGVDKQWNPKTKTWDNIDAGDVTSQQKQDAVIGKVTQLNNILTDKNIRSAVGPSIFGRLIGRGYDTQVTGGRQNFIADVEQIISKEFLDNLVNVKAQGATFGALQKSEQDALTQSATKIGNWRITSGSGDDKKVTGYNASEKDFKREVDRINALATKAFIVSGGDASQTTAKQMSDGNYYYMNADGSVVQLTNN